MADRARIRLLAGALAATVLPVLPSCAGPYYAAPARYPPYPPYYYDYHYYPDVRVYFHVYSGYYWYLDGRYWRRVPRLPSHIHLEPRYRVVVRIPDDPPYRHHDEHRRRYPLPKPVPEPRKPPQAPPQAGRPPPQAPPGTGSREREAREREVRRRDQDERQRNLRETEVYRKKPWTWPQ